MGTDSTSHNAGCVVGKKSLLCWYQELKDVLQAMYQPTSDSRWHNFVEGEEQHQ